MLCRFNPGTWVQYLCSHQTPVAANDMAKPALPSRCLDVEDRAEETRQAEASSLMSSNAPRSHQVTKSRTTADGKSLGSRPSLRGRLLHCRPRWDRPAVQRATSRRPRTGPQRSTALTRSRRSAGFLGRPTCGSASAAAGCGSASTDGRSDAWPKP